MKIKRLSNTVDKHLAEGKGRRYQIGTYHASDLSKCNRNHFYKFTTNRTFDADTFRRFEQGNLLHRWLPWVLRNSNDCIAFKKEVSLKYKLDENITLTGRSDLFVMWKGGNNLYEVKTTGSIKKCPHEFHKRQLNFYIKTFRDIFPSIEFQPVLYYWVKYNGKDKTVPYDFKESYWEKTLEDARTMHECLTENKLPEKERSWLCDYCLYKDLCDEDKIGD